MEKITAFDKKNLTSLRKEMDELLSKYGQTLNLNFQIGSMRFGPGEVEMKVTAKVVGGKDKYAEALDFHIQMPCWGKDGKIVAAKLADVITLKNDKGDELVGYNGKKYSKPYIFKSGLDGKSYVCDERYVLHYFGKKQA
jgi:hypothetical protein